MKNILFIFILLINLSCSHKTDRSTFTPICIDANLAKYSFSDIFEKITLIPLENNDEALFSNVSKFYSTEDRYYIYEQKSQVTFVFSKEGNFLFNTQHLQGDGEYHFPLVNDFLINPYSGNLEFLNPRGKIYVYNTSAQFVKQIETPKECGIVNGFTLLNDSTYILYSPKDSCSIFHIFQINSDKAFLEKSIEEELPAKLGRSDRLNTPFYQTNGQTYFSSNRFGRSIYRIDSINYNFDKLFQIEWKEKTLTKNNLEDKDPILFARNEMKHFSVLNQKLIDYPYLFISYLRENEFYTSIIQLQTNKSICFKNKFLTGQNFPIPIHFENGELIAIINPEYLKEMFPEGSFDKMTEQKIKQYTCDDNYVLVTYRLKESLFD